MALERESVEDIVDFTQPDVDRIEHRVGTLLNEFSHVVFSSGQVDPGKRQKRKVRFNKQSQRTMVFYSRCRSICPCNSLSIYVLFH